jgi:hypothetical protein
MLFFLSLLACYRPYSRYICTPVFKDNKFLRSHKTVEVGVFLNFLACCWKDLGPDTVSYKLLRIRIREAHKNLLFGFESGTLAGSK